MASPSVAVQPLDLSPDGIADLAEAMLVGGVAGWSMGVQGALAEFMAAGGRADVHRHGRTVEALTGGGALRLTVPDAARAFLVADRRSPDGPATMYVAVPRGSLAPAPAGVTVLGRDRAAIRPQDGGDVLVDLAAGHPAAAFCIRTGDAVLVAQLRAVEGAPWRSALEAVGAAVVAASPHRVVMTPLGRIEVWSAIPPEQGTSPDGPHTHLLPPLLATGREVPAGHRLPPEFAPAAAFHPPSGWRPPGR